MAHHIVSGSFVQMIGKTQSIRFENLALVVLGVFAGGVAQAGRLEEVHPHLVEVFTTTDAHIAGEAGINSLSLRREKEFHVYELDGIEQSKRVVLHRFQQLSEEDRARIQRAAMGLAKAMQYGVDRYPAIVFDGQAVVYGVPDMQTALAHYRAWRREGKR